MPESPDTLSARRKQFRTRKPRRKQPPTVAPDQQDRRTEARRSNVQRGATPTGGPGRAERKRSSAFLSKPQRVEDIQHHLRTQGYDVAVDGKWGPQSAKSYMDYIRALIRSERSDFAEYTRQRRESAREAALQSAAQITGTATSRAQQAVEHALGRVEAERPEPGHSFLGGAKRIAGGALDVARGDPLEGVSEVLGGGAEELGSALGGAERALKSTPKGRQRMRQLSEGLEAGGEGYMRGSEWAKGKLITRQAPGKREAAGFLPASVTDPLGHAADSIVNDIWDITAGAPGGIIIGAAHPKRAVSAIQQDYANRYGPLLKGDFAEFWKRNKEHPVFLGLDLAIGAGVILKGGELSGILTRPAAIRKLGLEGAETQFRLYRSPSRLGAHTQQLYDKLSRRFPEARGVGLYSRVAKRQHYQRERTLGEIRSQDVRLRRKARKLSGDEQVAFDVFRRYGDKAPDFLESEINQRLLRIQAEGISAKELRLQQRQIKILEDAREAIAEPSERLALTLFEGAHLSDKSTAIRKELGLVGEEAAEKILSQSARIFGKLPPASEVAPRLHLRQMAHEVVGPEQAEAAMAFLDRMAQKVAEATGKPLDEVWETMFSAEKARTGLPEGPDVLFQGRKFSPDLVREAAKAVDMPLRANLMSMANALEKGTITTDQFIRWTQEKIGGIAEFTEAGSPFVVTGSDAQVLESLLKSLPDNSIGSAIARHEAKNMPDTIPKEWEQHIEPLPDSRNAGYEGMDDEALAEAGAEMWPGKNLTEEESYQVYDAASTKARDAMRAGDSPMQAHMGLFGDLLEGGFAYREAEALSEKWLANITKGDDRLLNDIQKGPDEQGLNPAFQDAAKGELAAADREIQRLIQSDTPFEEWPQHLQNRHRAKDRSEEVPPAAAPGASPALPFRFAAGTDPEVTNAFKEVWDSTRRGEVADIAGKDSVAYDMALDNAIRAAVRVEDFETAQVLLNELKKRGGEVPGMEDLPRLYQASWSDKADRPGHKKMTAKDLPGFGQREKKAKFTVEEVEGEVKGVTEFSRGPGAIEFKPAADLSTVLHEPAHVIRRFMPDEYWDRFAEVFGWEKGKPLTRAQEEQFAEVFENYFYRGKEPTPQLRAPMAALSHTMRELYKKAPPRGGASAAEREGAYTILDELFDPEAGLKPGDGAFYAPDVESWRGKGVGGPKASLRRKGKREVYKSRGILYSQGRAKRGTDVVVKDFHRASRQMEHKVSLDQLTGMASKAEPELYPDTWVRPGWVLYNPEGHKLPRIYSETPDEEALLGLFPRELRSELKRQYDETLEQVFPPSVKAVPEHLQDGLLQLPKQIADSFVGHNTFLSSASKVPGIDALLRVVDDANTIAKAALVYGKLSYIPLNYGGNVIFLTIHAGPFAAPALVRASRILGRMDPELLSRIDYEVGEGSLAALTAGEMGDRLQVMIHRLAEYQSKVADQNPRRAAWIYSAGKRGFLKDDQIRKLFDGGDEVWKDGITYKEIRGQISEEAEKAMVSFRGMSPFQKAVMTRTIFIYGWMRGATHYAGRTALDKPLRSDLVAHLGDQEADRVEERLGKIVSYLKGVSPMGPIEKKLGLDTVATRQLRALNPVSTGGEVAMGIYNFARGDTEIAGPQVADYLSPPLKAGIELVTGYNIFFGEKYPNRWQALSGQITRIPLKKSIEGAINPKVTPEDVANEPLNRQPNYIVTSKGQGRRESLESIILGSATRKTLNIGGAQARGREEGGESSSFENAKFRLERDSGGPVPDSVLAELKQKIELDKASRNADTYVERVKIAAQMYGKGYIIRRVEAIDDERRAERYYNAIRDHMFRRLVRFTRDTRRREARSAP
jgi:hypothetical protein